MWDEAAIGVYHYFATGEASVRRESPDLEFASRVHEYLDSSHGTKHRLEKMFDECLTDIFLRDVFRVLSRGERGDHPPFAYRHLCFSVRTQPREFLVTTEFLEPTSERVRKHNSARKHFFSLVRCVPIHDALVAGAFFVYSHRDVGRLLRHTHDDI